MGIELGELIEKVAYGSFGHFVGNFTFDVWDQTKTMIKKYYCCYLDMF